MDLLNWGSRMSVDVSNSGVVLAASMDSSGIIGAAAFLAIAIWLRQLPFSSEPILYAYLQIVGSLLCFTYAANALVRFRGTHDRLTLILSIWIRPFRRDRNGRHIQLLRHFGLQQLQPDARASMAWMVSRTLLALVLIAALIVERRVPNSRDPGREIALALVVVVVVAYMTSVAFFGSTLDPIMHPRASVSRPADLLPAILFAIAAMGFGRRSHRHASPFDRVFCAALWMNVGCHVLATQSERLLDAPFTVAQLMKVGSYALPGSGRGLSWTTLECSIRFANLL